MSITQFPPTSIRLGQRDEAIEWILRGAHEHKLFILSIYKYCEAQICMSHTYHLYDVYTVRSTPPALVAWARQNKMKRNWLSCLVHLIVDFVRSRCHRFPLNWLQLYNCFHVSKFWVLLVVVAVLEEINTSDVAQKIKRKNEKHALSYHFSHAYNQPV